MASLIARALGLAPSTVSQWARVPAHHVAAVSALTGIPKAKLRPDVFLPVADGAPPKPKRRRKRHNGKAK